MPEINASLTAAAIVLRSQSKTALIDGVLMRRVFFDDFDRSVAQGLGNGWSWYWYDSWPSNGPETAVAYVDGANKELVLVSPSVGESIYESYVGFPVPDTGDLFFDFFTGSSPWSYRVPTIGFGLNGWDYTGIFVRGYSATQWVAGTWTTNETPLFFSPVASTWYRLHFRWTPSATFVKVWKRADPEPDAWHQSSSIGLNIPGDTYQPPFLDLYYTPPGPEPLRMTNIEIWSTQASWTHFGGLFLDAVKVADPAIKATFTAAAVIAVPTFTAAAILFKAIVLARTMDAEIIDGYHRNGEFSGNAFIVPEDLPGATDIVIRINGVDVTDDVIFADAEFMTQASGSPGSCRFRLKDMSFAYDIVVGQTLRLEVNGRSVWGGWVQSVKRQFFFPYTGSPLQVRYPTGPHGNPCDGIEPLASVPRALIIEGVDYNILFNKRYVFNKDSPANGLIKSWPAGTHDDAQIRWLCDNDLDLSGDGLDYTSMVEHVGSPNPDARGNPAGPGWKWGDAMRAIARYPGAIWYIDPDRRLVYTDVDTPNAGYALTDDPSSSLDLGYRDMELIFNGSNLVNDAMVWGVGQGAQRVRFQRTRDQASIDDHGLWQVGDFRGDLWRQESINKRSHSFVYGSPQNKRGGKDDAVSVAVTLFKPAFRVADKVDFWSHVFEFHDVIPVRRMRVTFPTPGDAQFDLVLSHAIDEPWNTFEYWFPPVPIPKIVIPITEIEPCPLPNLPTFWDDPVYGLSSMNRFISIFSDNFEREGGQPHDGEFGWWANINYVMQDPAIINGGVTLTSQTIILKNPVSTSVQIIMALDLTSWGGPSTSGYLYVASLDYGGPNYVYLNNQGLIGCAYGDQLPIDFSKYRGKKVYVRSVFYPGKYSGIRVWQQSDPEPTGWDATGPMSGLYENANAAMRGVRFVTSPPFVRLTGIAIFGDDDENPPFGTGMFWRGGSGWLKTWGYEDPEDGLTYAVTWGTDSLTLLTTSNQNQNPYYHYGIVWGYWERGSGWPHGASQKIVSFVTNTLASDHTETQTPPSAVKVTGKLHVFLGRSQGIDDRGSYPGQSTVAIEIRGGGSEMDSPYFVDGNDPYWLKDVHSYMEVPCNWDAPAVVVDFEFIAELSTIESDSGRYQWGVNVRSPYDTCRTMDPGGGPVMMPNTGSVEVETSNVEMYGIWRTPIALFTEGPGHFCVPVGANSATTDSKTCESVPISSIALQELYQTSSMWAVQLQSAYRPGTVDVTVDGTPAKPALDFVETTPTTGVITFLNSFLGAKEIIVCYFPEI